MDNTVKTICNLLSLGVLSCLLFQGCATYPPRQPTRYPQPETKPPIQEPQQTGTIAADFSRQAAKQVDQGRLDLAAATLERGLRVAPKDAILWSNLADVKLRQKQYQQAESLAAKSNSLAGGNTSIVEINKLIIDQARRRADDQ